VLVVGLFVAMRSGEEEVAQGDGTVGVEETWFHGIIDEVRISNIARYTEDFTPQRRFEPDEHTMALYHFDEGSGDVLTTLRATATTGRSWGRRG
jgi:hypothetical protein